jgi:6-phosphogluconolactonase
MQKRLTWVLGIVVLVSIGLLIACGTKYSSSSNGLVVVPSQGSAVMQTFSLNLSNGGISQINNTAGPPTPGLPSAVVLDPAGAFAYVLVTQNPQLPGSQTGVASFKVGTDGKLTLVGTTAMNGVNPAALAIDSAGKFLFVANGTAQSVSVLSIGSNGSLSGAGSAIVPAAGTTANLAALAVSPTKFPTQIAACTGQAAPTAENLYVADSANNLVWEFHVSSSGALTEPPASFTTGTTPSGVTVDPCNRFVYVSNGPPNNNVSAYTICRTVIVGTCPNADGSLVAVNGSPYPTQGFGPGPLSEDPYGNFVYVVNTQSNQLSAFKISPASGALTALSPATFATNSNPVSIAIRSDDTWIFVANFNSANVSQWAITPATGGLTAQPSFTTDNFPFGVAVK